MNVEWQAILSDASAGDEGEIDLENPLPLASRQKNIEQKIPENNFQALVDKIIDNGILLRHQPNVSIC